MTKRKADVINDAMRQRLMTNRDGKIATDQWLDLVTEPLVVLLLVVAPALVILGPRFAMFGAVALRLPLLLLIGAVAVVVPLLLRARRYARAPLHFEVMYADEKVTAPLFFWRPRRFESKSGEVKLFHKRLSPPMYYRPGYPYLVYYIEDNDTNILLSVAPADHPEADKWYPTRFFELRRRHRA